MGPNCKPLHCLRSILSHSLIVVIPNSNCSAGAMWWGNRDMPFPTPPPCTVATPHLRHHTVTRPPPQPWATSDTHVYSCADPNASHVVVATASPFVSGGSGPQQVLVHAGGLHLVRQAAKFRTIVLAIDQFSLRGFTARVEAVAGK